MINEFGVKDSKVIFSEQAGIAWDLLDAEAYEVIFVDLEGNILFINDSASQRYHKSSKALIGICIWDLYPHTHLNYLKILLNQVAATGQPIKSNFTENGQWNQTTIYPIKGKGKRVDGIALCIHNVTHQMEKEEQFKRVVLELINAQEDERFRISRDLHDDTGQRMTALLLQLRSIKDIIENDRNVAKEEVNNAILNLETIVKHIRQIFYQLTPPSLNRVALPKVLDAFCSSVEEANGIHVDFSCQEEMPELLENQVTVIYRFVQEGLTNVIKHSGATSAWVNLDYTDGDLNISLEDNGNGFDIKNTVEGLGLRGIRQRFISLNGCFEIESAPGKGTRLNGTLPFKSKGSRELI
jgi:signal transduction histidine kinase